MTKLDEQLREHYQNNSPSTSFGPVQEAVCELIANHQPRIETALEFGSGAGRNLEHLWTTHGILGQGIEINPEVVSDRTYNWIACGDENFLYRFNNQSIDAVFTCSVLCHIDFEAQSVVEHFERIARSLVVLAETNATPAWNYVPHPYAEWGYADSGRILSTPGNNCLYHLWTKKMPT